MGEVENRAEPYDAIVVGGGICGIIFLKYAREHGLRCLLLEKGDDVGGLWARLPAWQDIQNRKQDYAINDVPLDGVAQPEIHRHVHEWVRRYRLAPFIKLNCEVTAASRVDQRWRVETTHGRFRANYLIAASGVQNDPWIPDVQRSGSEIVEMHSSHLFQPGELRGKRVTVVGGGSSAWDLLDLALTNDATEINWVYRNAKWLLPTAKSKQGVWPNLRELSILQSIDRSPWLVNGCLRCMLRILYAWFQVKDLKPPEPFDIQKHQLIPGRSLMISKLNMISRHRSEIRGLRDREITLENGQRFESDVLLWGTGYRMNLEYLDLPEFRRVDTVDKLLPKLGSLVRSIDYPSLFFLGMGLANSTGSTPFFAAVQSKSIVAHITGRCEIPMKNTPHHVAHWSLLRYVARFDRANYPPLWAMKHFLLALRNWAFQNKTVKV